MGIRKETRMKIKQLTLAASFVVAAVVLLGAVSSVRAADEWFVLSEQTIKTADQGVDIKSQGGRWDKDVKQVRMSVEGADVQITKAVLGWDNRPDDTIAVGTIKAGGETAPSDAPLRKARLKGVTVQYKVLGEAPATLKVWGYD